MARSHDAGNGRLTDQDRQRLAAATIKAKRRLGLIPRRSILTTLASAIAVVFGGKGAR